MPEVWTPAGSSQSAPGHWEPMPVMRPRLPAARDLAPYLERIDESGWYSNFGPLTREFEDRLAAHYGAPPGVAASCANATLGLALCLQEAARPGRPICLVPSWTFVATAHAAMAAGMTPMFLDVDPESGQLTPETVESAAAAIDGVGAAMPVAPFGAPLDVAAWSAMSRRTGIPVVIDAAAAFDTASVSELPTVVSLHATKTLGCGEGGFVLSSDPTFITRVTGRANFGFLTQRLAELGGVNAKMSEYHAAVALASLARWPGVRNHLLTLARTYRERLAGYPALQVQPGWGQSWISMSCQVALEPPLRDRLEAALHAQNIETRRWWGEGCHAHPAFSKCPRADLPATRALAARTLGLPFFSAFTQAHIDRVAGVVEATLG